MADTDAMVLVTGVSRVFGRRIAIDRADLTLMRGRILGLLGASGSGKSTLLRTIAGLESIDAGTIAIDGRVVSTPGLALAPENRRVGMVFQDFALFPHLTVAQNVGFGLKGRADRDAVVGRLLERLRIVDQSQAFPHTLSGGEQQRVALARALARDPAVILLDEPFSSLDGSLRGEVREDLMETLRETGTSAIVVTHDAEDAMIMAEDLALMDGGRVIQTGTPRDLYNNPTSVAAARLLGPLNLVEARVHQGVATSVLGQKSAILPDGPVRMGIRPTDLRLTGPAQGLQARVASVSFAGGYCVVRVKTDTVALSLHLPGEAPRTGDVVGLTVDPARLMVLPD
ncbi:ABC transporter ATP-binding protein [Brevundimonas variabilis]|uniref:Iron(III) transport system ATP-binding protein n=1 Tax=Brevundimonas variabilis TaxID=74312 RepID=A0A7W9CLI7_9CAUL|nr:ABC transporter ATP-binding protein [Brevundimonas variabilis]MBB5747694.1 iron(III) transport system ATP-binding protein [Brevundimonas variabilis]